MFVHHRHASEAPFMGRLWWCLDPITIKKRCQSWTKLSGSAHVSSNVHAHLYIECAVYTHAPTGSS